MLEHISHDFLKELSVQCAFIKYHNSTFLFFPEKQASLASWEKGTRLLLIKTKYTGLAGKRQIRKVAFLDGGEGKSYQPQTKTEGKGKKKLSTEWRNLSHILVDQDSDYVSEKRSPDQVTCPLLQKIRSKDFKGNWWWQFLHLYAMWHTRSKLLATFWTICQGREIIIFFYILLSRPLSHLGVFPRALFYFPARIQTFTFDVIFLLHIRIAMPSFRRTIKYRERKGWHHFKHELLIKLF